MKPRPARIQDLARTFKTPPEGFDPDKASPRRLLHHGFPRKPSAKREPKLFHLWEKAFRPGTKMIEAKLELDPIMSRRNPLYKQQAEFQPTGWGGVVVLTPSLGYSPTEAANTVYGQWTQPYVYPLANPPAGPQTVGFWVGLDGYNNGRFFKPARRLR